jgi:hypothetical protein
MVWGPRELDNLISDPKQALDVFDFEPVAKRNVPPAHFGYMVTGIDDEVTLRANREGFLKFQLNPRRLVDVSAVDMTTEILGVTYDSPIVIAPTSSNQAFHPDGEIAVAKAAKAGNHLQILSTVATTSIEQAIAARGAPVWFQLYPTRDWEVGEALVKRAERAGSPVVAVTVDGPAPSNWETLVRLRRTDTRQCDGCHGRTFRKYVARKPNFDGIDLSGVTGLNAPNLTWDSIKRLRDTVKMRLYLKVSSPARMRYLLPIAALMGSLFRTIAGAWWIAAEPQSKSYQRLSKQWATACLFWWTAASVAAQRHWRWAQQQCVSDGPISGASPPSVSRVSSGSLNSSPHGNARRHAAGRGGVSQASHARHGAEGLKSRRP